MTLQDILAAKGSQVFTVEPEATLADVVRLLTEHNVGCLLVCRREGDQEKPVGIVTERDLLHAQAAGKGPLEQVKVTEVMTAKLLTGSPEDAVELVMGLMTTKRIRHLPVLSQGRLVGLVSIGDLVKAQHDQLAAENRFMKDYIQG